MTHLFANGHAMKFYNERIRFKDNTTKPNLYNYELMK